ncbi:peptidase M10A and M12B, matrixin and adamalysin [Caballeronia fortuita]|uniref:Peptidase M10A and M12B, matrixin and adamalysin n=1 Tax=Caballeronia fortuita TaxID=1777138 RepID=A0A158B7D6_9BURK|nr:hypothetical protein [Caballeronia fortuita]SAK66005.1 peptidase M10A and M12B, matrixin and adamalysin [Caballeronia fortuita]
MDVKPQRLTGQEAFWGNYKPTDSQLSLMNKSPLLVGQIQNASDQVKSGEIQPLNVSDEVGTAFTSHDGTQIALNPSYTTGSDANFVGVLAHELGHTLNVQKDAKFEQQFATHPRDPEAFNSAATPKGIGQTEAELNKWKVSNEIQQNTTAPGHPGTSIVDHRDPTFAGFDNVAKKYANANLTPQQMDDRIIGEGSSSFFTGGNGYNFSQYEHAGHNNSQGAAPTEPGNPASVTFGIDKDGNVASARQQWNSGDTSTQTYKDGKLQSSQTVDPQGNPLRTANYQHNADGSYNMNVTDGSGRKIQQSEFNPDGSGIERGFNADGSRLETQFDKKNQTTNMTSFDPQGRETQKDYFSRVDPKLVYDNLPPNVTPEMMDDLPAVSRNTNQIVNHPDGSRTLYSFNDNGKVGIQDEYDANGQKTAMHAYDSDTGRLNFDTRYNADGSRTFTTVGANNQGTRVDVGKDGERGAPQNISFTPDEMTSFKQLADDASKIGPPQPVGSDITLGGQKNYFDPANNRRTNQVVTNPDGSRTLFSYNMDNMPALQSHYGPDGRPIKTTYFDQRGAPSTEIDYGKDGGRVVRTTDSDKSQELTYNAQNQLTQRKDTGGDGSVTEVYDPSTGRVTNKNVLNADGSRQLYSMNDQGNVGSRTEFDANGDRTRSTVYDSKEGSGTLTNVNYNSDGSRQVDKYEGGNVTSYTADSNGSLHDKQTTPIGQPASRQLDAWKTQGSGNSAAAGSSGQANAASDGQQPASASAGNAQLPDSAPDTQQPASASSAPQADASNSGQSDANSSVAGQLQMSSASNANGDAASQFQSDSAQSENQPSASNNAGTTTSETPAQSQSAEQPTG